MKKTRLLVLGFLLCLQLASQNSVDVLQYDFSITLSDKHDTVIGEARIRFINKKSPAVVFDLASQHPNGKGMQVTGIFRDNISKNLKRKDQEPISHQLKLFFFPEQFCKNLRFGY